MTYKEIFKVTTLFGTVQGLNLVLNIIRTKIVAILIGPAGVGLNGIYNETRELLHSTTNLGLDISGVRGISLAYEKIQNKGKDTDSTSYNTLYSELDNQVQLLRSWVLLLALFGAMLCMVCASPLSYFTFGDYEHTWGYVILSPAVAFSTITCGELAVLKGLRQLKSLAIVSVINVLLGLLVSVPIYFIWGISGVLPALVILFGAVMLCTMFFSYRAHKPSFVFTKNTLRGGRSMLSIGTVFVISGMLGHLVELFIQSYLNKEVSTDMVGLYNAGCTLTASCIGLVFAAMDQDYFPRLTGVITDKFERANTVRSQQEVTMMIATPLLVTFTVVIPFIVPLLLSAEFTPIIPMAQAASIGLLFRTIYLSHAYLSLAAGDKWTYFIINCIGAVDLLVVIAGYWYGGLAGMGMALTAQHGLDLTLVYFVSRIKYGVKLGWSTIINTLCHLSILIATYVLCTILEGWRYWLAGGVMIIASILYAYSKYRKGR